MNNKLIYKRLADVVAILHWIVIVYLILGGGLQLLFPGYAIYHLIFVITVGLSQLIWLGCPLVALENALRAKYDPDTRYYGSFTYHALKKLGINVPPIVISLQMVVLFVITAGIVLVNNYH